MFLQHRAQSHALSLFQADEVAVHVAVKRGGVGHGRIVVVESQPVKCQSTAKTIGVQYDLVCSRIEPLHLILYVFVLNACEFFSVAFLTSGRL
jgi:hypothetical protein